MDTGWVAPAPAVVVPVAVAQVAVALEVDQASEVPVLGDQVVEGPVLKGPASGAQVVGALEEVDQAAEDRALEVREARGPVVEGLATVREEAADGATNRQLTCGLELAGAAVRHLFPEWWPALRAELLVVAVSRPKKNSSRFLAR
jgi:hypothetical protein